MKILLVYSLYSEKTLRKPLFNPEEINFGISYIAGLLEKNGHAVRLAVLSSNLQQKSLELLKEIVDDFKPAVVGFSSVASEYPFIIDAARSLSQSHSDVYQVIGGTHVSLNPGAALKESFDAICVGEGEYPMLELVSQLEKGEKPSGIANMNIKNGDSLEKNPARSFIEDLDSLPFPNRDMWFEWIEETPEARFSLLLGRGCPFLCTYCCNHALRKLAEGSYVRFRSPGNIIDELRYLYKKFPKKRDYFFEVETINVNPSWILDLCEKLRELNDDLDEPLEFGTNFRVGVKSDYDEIFSAFKSANIRHLSVGLESGCERVRKDILKRNYSNEDVIQMVKSARKYSLSVTFQNMIGLPGETEEDFIETVRMNRICQPDKYYLNIFYPYPGTELAQTCEKMGLLKDSIETRMERAVPTMELPTFSSRKIKKRCKWFYYDVYKGERSLISCVLRLAQHHMLYSDPVVYNAIRRNSLVHRGVRVLRYLFMKKAENL